MWRLFVAAGIAVYAIVAGLILWCALAYRRRPSDGIQAGTTSRNLPLEIAWTVVPLLVVAGLFAKTLAAESVVDAIAPRADEVVQVVGFRWGWRFFYPKHHVAVTGTSNAPPELALALGRTTEVRLTSTDVNHAFWIPAFLFKRDAIAGTENRFDLTPAETGVYPGKCAEFCGLYHAHMTFVVRVLPPAEYERWLRAH